jgi:Flp pilus assembly protein TadD
MTPDQAIALALHHFNSGRFAESEALCRQVLAVNPDHLSALQLHSLLEARANRLDSAIALIQRAISLSPGNADYYLNLGELQRRAGQLESAAESLAQALRLAPANAIAHYNLGCVLADQLKADEAMAEFQLAAKLKPDLAEAHVRMGVELRRRGQRDEALAAFERAIAAQPGLAEAHWNYALLLLQRGNLEAGWREYEWRRTIASICPPRNFRQPQWTGQKLSGQRVFLHIEQAFGDMIHFARFAPMVAERGGRVLLQSPPELVRVFGSLRGIEQVITTNEPLPDFDLHCPLLSLGGIFCPKIEQIPSAVPYLYAEQKLVESWRERIKPFREKFKVGLIWAGRQMVIDGGNRSIRLSLFAPLARIDRVTFFSLQKENSERPPTEMELIDWSADLHDFADTAALMANLDLIISIDTAAAHLAGALGRPTGTLLLRDADWRWLVDRADSPWYPTMRLFRQPAEGNWEAAIADVAEAMRDAVRLWSGATVQD